jgi:RNA-directed DNA polymerase
MLYPASAFGIKMIKKRKSKSWYKPKPYIHFSSRLTPRDFKWLVKSFQDPKFIIDHPFLPFIHRVINQRRFRAKKDGSGLRESKGNKERHIYYAPHIDAHIYAYYNKIISDKYEEVLSINPNISSMTLAYRKIPIEGSDKNKGNIEFAFEVFQLVKSQKSDCEVICFDIKSFFDNLDHTILKKAWCKFLSVRTLEDDHYSVFKSITNYRYVEEKEILKLFKRKSRRALYGLKADKLFSTNEFRNKIIEKDLVKSNTNKNAKNKLKGIPQGTPISALLSNIYMFEFDKFILDNIVKPFNCIYRRYSDDLIFICPPGFKTIIEKIVSAQIGKLELSLQSEKTSVTEFKYNNSEMKCIDKPLTYLGFDFYGDRTLIKQGSLSKYYRTVRTSIKVRAKIAALRPGNRNKKIYRKRIFKLSHLAVRNFIAYGNRASNMMDDDINSIKKQLKNHRSIIQREIKKHEIIT